MDAVRNILDWLSQNSRNLSEAQRREIHHVLESLKNQLETRTGMGSNSRAHQFSRKMGSTSDRNERKFHEMNDKVDIKHASLESKIQQITNIISKETGYINGKIDTITKGYNEQIKILRNQVKDLKNEKNKTDRGKNEVSDRDIDQLTESLRGLMNSFVPKPPPYPPNFNPPPPPPYYDCPPPYHSYPPMAPNQNVSYIPPTHSSPQFFVAPGPPGPSMVQSSLFSFPSNYPGSNSPKSLSCDKNEKVYRFSGSSSYGTSGRVHLNDTTDSTHQKPHFNKPFSNTSDGKTDCNSRKKYCDPNWKKTDIRHQQHGSNVYLDIGRKSSPNETNAKSHHEASSHKGHVSASSNNNADRARNKRYQQFGKNRPQTHDDGGDSDTSTSLVSSKGTHNKCNISKPGHPHNPKETKNKCLQSTFTEKPTNFQRRAKNTSTFGDGENCHTSTSSPGFLKTIRNEPTPKAEISGPSTSKTTTKKKNSQSTTKNDTSELEKLQYPSRAEALKNGIDIFKRIDPPSTCLGKMNGVPFSKPAHCLEDIYNFEKEFGPCQVIRY